MRGLLAWGCWGADALILSAGLPFIPAGKWCYPFLRLDVALDVALDVTLDIAPDVALDVAPDIVPDVAPDAILDIAPDIASDVALDPWGLLS